MLRRRISSFPSSSSTSSFFFSVSSDNVLVEQVRSRRSLAAAVSSLRRRVTDSLPSSVTGSGLDGAIPIDTSRFAESQAVTSVGDPDDMDFAVSSVVREDLEEEGEASAAKNASQQSAASKASPRASGGGGVRIFDPRRHNKYFDDILFNDDELAEKKSNCVVEYLEGKRKAAQPTHQQHPADSSVATTAAEVTGKKRKKRLRLESVDTGLGMSAMKAALSFLDEEEQDQGAETSPSDDSYETGEKNAAADPAIAATISTLVEEVQSATPGTPVLPAGVRGNMMRVSDLKRSLRRRGLLSCDGGPVSSKQSLLGLLRKHSKREVDVSGDGLFVSLHGNMSLAQKMPPSFTPPKHFDQSGVSVRRDIDLLDGGKGGGKSKSVNPTAIDDSLPDTNLHAEPQEWSGVELDLETDEQAETNRIVQEAAELERLEELDETGKLDTLISTGKFGFIGGAGEGAAGSIFDGTTSAADIMKQKSTSEILKSFAGEFHQLPDAPAGPPSTGAIASLLQSAGERKAAGYSETLKVMPGVDAAKLIGQGLAPAPALKAAAATKPTPKPLKQTVLQMKPTTPPTPTSIPSGVNLFRSSSLTQSEIQAAAASLLASSSAGGRGGAAVKSPTELLDLFVEVVPTFFVPVMLLRVTDALRDATGRRDIDKVIRRSHFFFDFKMGGGAGGGDALRDMQVKLKPTLEHSKKGAANALYSDMMVDGDDNGSAMNAAGGSSSSCSSSAAAGAVASSGASARSQHSAPVSTVTPLAPRIAPIRLATDSVDAECQAVMSALNAVQVARTERDGECSSSSSGRGEGKRRNFSATASEILQALKSGDDSSGVASEIFSKYNEKDVLNWAASRPRMFFVSATTNSTAEQPPLIQLRPLDVAPGAVGALSSSSSEKENQEEAEFSTTLPGAPSKEVVKALHGKIRAGLWMEWNSIKKKFPAGSDSATAKWLHHHHQAEDDKEVLLLLPPWSSSSSNSKLPWLQAYGRDFWVDVEKQRVRRFTGTSDIDDVEHFGLRVLHSQLKSMVCAEKIDLPLRKEILPALPPCCAALFSEDFEKTVRLLKAHPTMFAVSKQKTPTDGADEDDILVGLASVFRK